MQIVSLKTVVQEIVRNDDDSITFKNPVSFLYTLHDMDRACVRGFIVARFEDSTTSQSIEIPLHNILSIQ